jgi:predicted AAA+ superfamily ATPase
MSVLFNRHIISTIAQASRLFPILLLTGPRQVGKTTILQQMQQHEDKPRHYITFDDQTQLTEAKRDPALFMQQLEGAIFFDEVQYAPELFPYIKMRVDKQQQAGACWLTGSQPYHLMHGVTESLAGRVAILSMGGLSLREIKQAPLVSPFLPGPLSSLYERMFPYVSADLLFNMLWRGSFPRIWAKAAQLREEEIVIQHALFFQSYLQTYIQRDVRALSQIQDLQRFTLFIRATAARTAQILNISELARDVDISPNTAKSWLSVLEAAGLIFLLPSFSSNVTNRLVKMPKVYFTDTGLACYLSGWNTVQSAQHGAMSGALWETFVVNQILLSYTNNGQVPALYYYRDRDGKEIDLLLFQNQTLFPIEIKKTAMPSKGSIPPLRVLEKFPFAVGPAAVICFVETPVALSEHCVAIPLTMV